jgi:hypothetical protein
MRECPALDERKTMGTNMATAATSPPQFPAAVQPPAEKNTPRLEVAHTLNEAFQLLGLSAFELPNCRSSPGLASSLRKPVAFPNYF